MAGKSAKRRGSGKLMFPKNPPQQLVLQARTDFPMPVEIFPSSSTRRPPKSIFKAPKQKLTSLQLKRASAIIQAQLAERTSFTSSTGSGPKPLETLNGGGIELPTELLMLVLDLVNDDKELLRNCSLVSKSWLPCARYFLLSNKFSLNELNVDLFLSILPSPYATIGSYIQHLTIQTQQLRILLDQSLSFITEATSVSWKPVLGIPACLQYIRESSSDVLSSLTIHDIGPFSVTDFNDLPPLLQSFASLIRLELSQCVFATIQEFFDVICSCPGLRRLILTNIMINDVDETITAPHILYLPRRLAHLTLQTAHQSDILEWILEQPHIPGISSLSLGGIGQSERDQEITGRFIMALGTHLKFLKIYLTSWSPAVTLAHNTSLQSFTISRYRLRGNSTSDPATAMFEGFSGLLAMLEQISSSKITQINLRFVNNPEDLATVPWNHLERLCKRANFKDLKALRIRCVGKTEDMRRLIRHMFPRLSLKGIIQFRCDSDSDNEEV